MQSVVSLNGPGTSETGVCIAFELQNNACFSIRIITRLTVGYLLNKPRLNPVTNSVSQRVILSLF